MYCVVGYRWADFSACPRVRGTDRSRKRSVMILFLAVLHFKLLFDLILEVLEERGTGAWCAVSVDVSVK
jgi:hypothetical protein